MIKQLTGKVKLVKSRSSIKIHKVNAIVQKILILENIKSEVTNINWASTNW